MSHDTRSTRRQLLRGAGGIALSLPFLPSLLPRSAQAQTLTAPPRLVLMARSHGNVRTNNDVAAAALTNKLELYPGHQISYAPMPRTVANGLTVVTPIVQGSSSALTDRLLGKMNVLRGLDNTPGISQHTWAAFGAIGFENDPASQVSFAVPSVDQFAAWSPAYYRPGSFKFRSIITGGDSFSLNYQNPTARTGALGKVAADSDPVLLFNKLFAGAAAPMAGPTRRPLVDHVLESYRSLRQSNQRLSAEDSHRLDAHVEMIRDLQSRVSAVAVAGAGCVTPAAPAAVAPTTPAGWVARYQLYNDLIAAAFKCGLTRVAAVTPGMMGSDLFRDTAVPWHNLAPPLAAISRQIHFEKVVLDLAAKLDVEEADGKTYLDNSLIISTSDAGAIHHRHVDMLMVTFGGASGYFKTGLYVDYRNLAKMTGEHFAVYRWNPGIFVQQFWANVLDALRIPRSDWQALATNGGWGAQAYGANTAAIDYVTGISANAGAKLAVVT